MLHHCSHAPYGLFVFKKETVYLIICLMENVHTAAKSDDIDIANKCKIQIS